MKTDLINFNVLDYVDSKTGKRVYDPSIYISENGQVLSKKARNDKFIRPQIKNGYMTFNIGPNESVYLQRAVAEMYLTKPTDPTAYDVRFKDGNKENCSVDNLEWYSRRK